MARSEKNITAAADALNIDNATLRNLIGYHLRRASTTVQTDLARTLKPFGLRMITYTALVLIVDNPGLSQTQVAQTLDIERPNLVVIIDELEQRELIVREKVPTDRRAYALKATLAGTRLCEKAVRAVQAHEAKLFSGWDEDTKRMVVEALSRIQNHSRES